MTYHPPTKAVAVAAQEAFWQRVAELRPDIKTGDFPPDLAARFDVVCEMSVEVWLSLNEVKDRGGSHHQPGPRDFQPHDPRMDPSHLRAGPGSAL